MTEKILTIVIPSYNMQQYLPQCLDSLLVSDLERVEVLVVNDGSRDRTSEIGHEYECRFPKSIIVIDKENGNYGSCINAALKIASGKYIKILDADDSFEKDNFERFITYLENVDVDLVVANYVIVNSLGEITSQRILSDIEYQEQSFENILDITKRVGVFEMHCVTYKREILRNINYYQMEGISYTDQQWMLVPMVYVNSVAFFSKFVYRYLIGRDGQTVALESRLRSIRQHAIMCLGLVDEYNKVYFKISEAKRCYLDYRIVNCQLPYIYRTYLLKQSDFEKYAELKEFDEALKKKNYSIYNSLNHEKIASFSPFHYITYWRKYYNSKKRLFFLKQLSQMIKLFEKWERLIHIH